MTHSLIYIFKNKKEIQPFRNVYGKKLYFIFNIFYFYCDIYLAHSSKYLGRRTWFYALLFFRLSYGNHLISICLFFGLFATSLQNSNSIVFSILLPWPCFIKGKPNSMILSSIISFNF